METEAKTLVGNCAWTDTPIYEGDDYVTLYSDEVVTQDAWEENGCETEDAGKQHKDDCIYYGHGDCYYTTEYFDRHSVEALDGNAYLPADCDRFRDIDGGTVYTPPNTYLSDFDYAACEDCGVVGPSEYMHYHDGSSEWYCEAHLPDNDGLLEYSDSPLEHCGPALSDNGTITSLKTCKLPIMGVELECESSNRKECIDIVRGVLDGTFAIAKSDGSLDDDTGFEVCSVPATLARHREVWPGFVRRLAKAGAKSFHGTDDRCGLHIHINGRAFTGDAHKVRFCQLIGHPDNEKLSVCVGQRSTSYAKIRDKGHVERFHEGLLPCDLYWSHKTQRFEMEPTEESPHPTYRRGGWVDMTSKVKSVKGWLRGEHYDAATPTAHGTIEVRIFKGTLHPSGVIRALEFVYSMWVFSQDCGHKARSTDYLDWLAKHRHDYAELTAFLWRKSDDFRQSVKRNRLSSGAVKALAGTSNDDA